MSTEAQESVSPAWSARRRIALVVGVNGPAVPGRDSLKYAEQDAIEMAQVLQDCGYELFRSPLVGEQATTETVQRALLDLVKVLTDGDLVVFFFSGHGEPMIVTGGVDDIYFVTHNFDVSDIEFYEQTHLSMRILRKVLYEHKKAVDVLIILECCYAGNIGDLSPDLYLDELRQRIAYFFDAPPATSGASQRGLRLTLAATNAGEIAHERDGHGLMTGLLLPALQGERLKAFDINEIDNTIGNITFESLFSYVSSNMPKKQKPIYTGKGEQLVLACHPEKYAQLQFLQQRAEREQRLRAMIFDYQAFLRDRLSSFVGREQELDEVRGLIAQLQQTGGYLTITGPAGQGKSSLIARLIHDASKEEGLERIAYHFIPLDPSPKHQFALLFNLMARLILKYDLSDFYPIELITVTPHDYFPKVLQQIAKKGGREVIYIDGLDQLEEGGGADLKPKRDLSFLPSEVPAGIIFVLGTRPNDTLEPLQSKKPHVTYELPNLSRDDFDAILRHRGVALEPGLADQFYQNLNENALFLDLVAKELAERGQITPAEVEAIIKRIADNPNNLFGLAIERISWREVLWEQVMKPLLGILLVAGEPLAQVHLKQIVNLHRHQMEPIDKDRLREGLTRLGGLVISVGQERYTLFHLKLRDYLYQQRDESGDQNLPDQGTGVFDTEDVQRLHAWLADWCEQGDISYIWKNSTDAVEQGRREYARYHYITHLYHAHKWQRLFSVLDAQEYGQAKIHWDPSTHLFAQDVELGQQTASWEGYAFKEGVAMLSLLWRYTLLRCSLGSRADRYPEAAFRLMTVLGQQQIARNLAELETDPAKKVRVLCQIAEQLQEQLEERKVWMWLLLRASDVTQNIQDEKQQARALRELGQVLAQASEWQEAKRVIQSIKDAAEQAAALSRLGLALAQAGQWHEAKQVIRTINNKWQYRAGALSELGVALAQAGKQDEAIQVWQEAKRVIRFIKDEEQKAAALSKLGVALAQAGERQEAKQVIRFIMHNIKDERLQTEALSKLGVALAQAGERQEAERVIWLIMKDKRLKAEALSKLGLALAQAGKPTEATHVWHQAEIAIRAMENKEQQAEALRELSQALTQAGEWHEAERIIMSIKSEWQARALSELGVALAQAGKQDEAIQVWQEAKRVIWFIMDNIKDEKLQAEALGKLGLALAQAGKQDEAIRVWQKAEQVINTIWSDGQRAEALRELRQMLAQAGKPTEAIQVWDQAEQVINTIWDKGQRAEVLSTLAQKLAQARNYKELLQLVRQSWQATRTRGEAFQHFELVTHFIPQYPELGMALFEGFTWVDHFFWYGSPDGFTWVDDFLKG